MHYIMMIAINDTFVAFAFSFGFPTGITCNIQAFIQVFFKRFSWFWTTLLVFQLTSVVLRRKYLCNIYTSHYILWPINIFLQFIVFSNSTSYGNNVSGYSVCSLYNEKSDKAAELWGKYASVLILQFCLCVIVTCSIFTIIYSLYLKFIDSDISDIEMISEAWSTIIMYPISMVISYLPFTSYGYYVDNFYYLNGKVPKHSIIIDNSLAIAIPIYGTLLTFIFYSRTEDAQTEYIKLFKKIFLHMTSSRTSVKDTSSSLELELKNISTIETTATTINIITNDIRRITIT